MPDNNAPVYFDQSSGQWRVNPRRRTNQGFYTGSGTAGHSITERQAAINELNRQANQISQANYERKHTKAEVHDYLHAKFSAGYKFTERDDELVKVYNLEDQLKREQKEVEERSSGLLGTLKKAAPIVQPWRLLSGSKVGDTGGSVVQRGLDLVSRGNYAGAGFLKGVTDQPDYNKSLWSNLRYANPIPAVVDVRHPLKSIESLPGRVGEGIEHAGKGLWGTEKTTGADVLKENFGIKGVQGAAQGFGIDVAADPATWVTGGSEPAINKLIKSGAKSTVEHKILNHYAKVLAETGSKGQAKRSAQAFIKSSAEVSPGVAVRESEKFLRESGHGITRNSRSVIMRQAERDATKTAEAAGETLSKEAIKKVRTDAADAAAAVTRRQAAKDLEEEAAAFKALTTNHQWELKGFGRTFASSEAPARITNKASKLITESRYGGKLNEAFRTDALTGTRMHTLWNRFANVSSEELGQKIQHVDDVLNGKVFQQGAASKSERSLLYRSLAHGDKAGLDERLSAMYDEISTVKKRAFDDEVEAGVRTPDEWVDDYMPQYFKPGAKLDKGIGSPLIASTHGGGNRYENAATALMHAGDKMNTDIASVMAHRLTASHKEIAKHDFYKHAGEAFGITPTKGIAGREFKSMAADNVVADGGSIHKTLKGIYFDKDTHQALSHVNKVLSDPEYLEHWLKLFDKIQGSYKFGAVALNPGAQLRNLYGDGFVNMLDGVVDPMVYKRAYALIRGKADKYIFKVHGHEATGEEILNAYRATGLKTGLTHSDTAGVLSTSKFRKFSESREDFMRMAHFTDAIKKEARDGGTWNEITQRAAARVKKYNLDFTDLTAAEQKVFRRAVPFYSYMRKITPLMMETYFTRPGRLTIATKGQRAIQGLLGENPNTSVFPGGAEGIVPQFIRDMSPFKLHGGNAVSDPLFMEPDLPYNKINDYFGGFQEGHGALGHLGMGLAGFGTSLVDQSSPLIKAPVEEALGYDLPYGNENQRDWRQKLIEMLPIGGSTNVAATGANKSGPAARVPYGYEKKTGEPKYLPGPLQYERVLNFLTGAQFRVATPARQLSELKRIQDQVQAQLADLKAKQKKKDEGK